MYKLMPKSYLIGNNEMSTKFYKNWELWSIYLVGSISKLSRLKDNRWVSGSVIPFVFSNKVAISSWKYLMTNFLAITKC